MKNKRREILFAISAVVAIFISGGIADAQEKNYRNYVRFNGGFNQPTGDLDEAGYDGHFDIALLYGRYFGRYLALEGELGFFRSERDVAGSSLIAGSYVENDRIGVLSATATAKGVYPVGGLEFYAGGGVGAYYVSFKTDVAASNLGNDNTDGQEAVLGFHILGGASYNISEGFLVGGEIKYLWTDDVDIAKQISDIPIRLEGDLNGYSVNFTFGFRF